MPSDIVEPDIDTDTLRFAEHLVATIAEDPMVRPSYRLAARKHLARLRAGMAQQLSAVAKQAPLAGR